MPWISLGENSVNELKIKYNLNPDKKFEFPLKAKNFRDETINMRNEKYEDWCRIIR